jgi:RNase H-fold protein (predicted Holliday junction resolvase)
MAETRPGSRSGSKAGKREALDHVAAAVLLRDYLERERANSKGSNG